MKFNLVDPPKERQKDKRRGRTVEEKMIKSIAGYLLFNKTYM